MLNNQKNSYEKIYSEKDNENSAISAIPPRLKYLGKHRLYGNWTVSMQSSDDYTLSYIREGRAAIIVRDKKYKAEKGDIFLYRPHEMHGGKSVKNYNYATTMFRIDFADESFHHKALNKKLDDVNKFSASENWKLRSILDSLILEINKKDINALLIKNYLIEIFEVINEMIEKNRDNKRIGKASKSYKAKICIKAKGYIEENYAKRILLKDIAEHVALSVSRFCHIFSEYTKTAPLNYITKTRIDKAKQLLKETDKSITEIADQAGFSDLNYFIRTFKKTAKITPSSFRKNSKIVL